MHNNEEGRPSCVMLACGLHSPVPLSCVFSDEDLDIEGGGVENETHLTLLFSPDLVLPKEEIISDIKEAIGEETWESWTELFQKGSKLEKVLEHFQLDVFENDDRDIIVLLLKRGTLFWRYVRKINRKLRKKYGIENERKYNPHITLAKVRPGAGRKYLSAPKLLKLIEQSKLSFEDITYSIGGEGDREQFNLTSWNAISRYFRLKNLREEEEELWAKHEPEKRRVKLWKTE